MTRFFAKYKEFSIVYGKDCICLTKCLMALLILSASLKWHLELA